MRHKGKKRPRPQRPWDQMNPIQKTGFSIIFFFHSLVNFNKKSLLYVVIAGVIGGTITVGPPMYLIIECINEEIPTGQERIDLMENMTAKQWQAYTCDANEKCVKILYDNFPMLKIGKETSEECEIIKE